MPSGYLLVLHADAAVSLEPADYLVRLVFFSVRKLLILPLDQLDCLAPVVRSLDSTLQLALQLLEPIAFFNVHVKLLALACRYACLDSEVKTYFLPVCLWYFEILSVYVACHLQVVSVRLPDQVRVRQFVHVPELASRPDEHRSRNSLDLDLVAGLERILLAVFPERYACQFRLELQFSVFLKPSLDQRLDRHLVRDHPGQDGLLLCGRDVFETGRLSFPVFVEPCDVLDGARVQSSQLLGLVQIQDVVVEPLAFDEQHLQLLLLPLVQPLLDDLAIVDLDDLAETPEGGQPLGFPDPALLLFGASFSAVNFCHQVYLLLSLYLGHF